ncbi:Modification methylase HpaII [compost metagenome]
MYIPTVNSYFSSIGGLDLGLVRAGLKLQSSLELDKGAIRIMEMNRHLFGDHNIIHQDITQVTVLDQKQADIMAATYPCQKYSTIGDIHGTRTGEDLYLHAFRHFVLGQPEAFLLENVPGMLKFKVVMEAMTKLPGYYVHIFCPVDTRAWLPQRRDRVIIFGTKRNFDPRPPKGTKPVSLSSLIEKDPIIDIPNNVFSRIKGNYRDKPIIVDPSLPNCYAPTCVAHYAKDQGTRLVVDKHSKHGIRPFTVREWARLQGFPDEFVFPKNKNGSDIKKNYVHFGNAVPVHMGEWAGKELLRYFN